MCRCVAGSKLPEKRFSPRAHYFFAPKTSHTTPLLFFLSNHTFLWLPPRARAGLAAQRPQVTRNVIPYMCKYMNEWAGEGGPRTAISSRSVWGLSCLLILTATRLPLIVEAL